MAEVFKCDRCRFKTVSGDKCGANHSPFFNESIEFIEEVFDVDECDAFFSEDDAENFKSPRSEADELELD